MATRVIDETRIRRLNDEPARDGEYVLYWMQQSQRAEFNHALEYAVQRANERGLRLLVAFGLMDDYPEANVRHYRFMLEGLRETRDRLRRRRIPLVVRRGDPDRVALGLARRAALVVCDRGYLRHQKAWRRRVAREAGREVVQVESDVVVPVDVVTDKAEYAARTIRPKIHARLDDYLVPLRSTPLKRDSPGLSLDGVDLDDLDRVLAGLDLDTSVPPVSHVFRGGTGEAKRRLRRFIEHDLPVYAEGRSEPAGDRVSHLSMYLHFGQISPVQVALEVRDAARPRDENAAAFLEELIVRRELAHNFVEFHPDYDRYRGLPEWARRTLDKHRGDERPYLYPRRRLERAGTHDPYWNAAMREMRYTGYLHNAMRMYWGKKIIEWSRTPESAYRLALALNNRYFLDGRDPSSFANVGWLFGLHDRPWGERAVFGTVRYLSTGGLERKADTDAYVAMVDRRVEEARAHGVRFDDDPGDGPRHGA